MEDNIDFRNELDRRLEELNRKKKMLQELEDKKIEEEKTKKILEEENKKKIEEEAFKKLKEEEDRINKIFEENIKKHTNYNIDKGKKFIETKIPKQDYIPRKEAALEVIKWVNSNRILAVIGIIIPFVVISLSIMFLDVIALGLWAVISVYLGFLLVKGTRYRQYLINEYNIEIIKPSYNFNRKPGQNRQKQDNFIRRY